MLKITNTINVYGRDVEFTIKEIAKYKNDDNLDITEGNILEYLLDFSGITSFDDNSSSAEIHDLCIKAINEYKNSAIDIAKDIHNEKQ